ncbi:hypothetical protein AGMMS50256_19440 [Betaproteobacteria bacterium]|nr:hypothetical protein AGMMS50256_19440 [Betaproteobacteria bacterium]
MRKVLTYGKFDHLNPEHIEFLRHAKLLGDYLIVSLNAWLESDQTIEERKNALLSLAEVDDVFLENDPLNRWNDIITLDASVLALGKKNYVLWKQLNPDIEIRFIQSKTAYIPFLVVCMGQACSLKCRDCGNFSPYAPKDTRFYSTEQIIRDLQVLIKQCSAIEILQIQGGEPFLHPGLGDLLNYLIREESRIHTIVVATNGAIPTPPQNVLEYLKDKKCFVRISNYKNVPRISRKIENTVTLFEKNHIRYGEFNFASGIAKWNRMGSHLDTYHEASDEIVKKRFNDCAFRGCLTLENSTLGYCSRSVIATRLQNFHPGADDYLQVSDSVDFRIRLVDYVTNRHYMECCRLCNGTAGELILPAIQLNYKE